MALLAYKARFSLIFTQNHWAAETGFCHSSLDQLGCISFDLLPSHSWEDKYTELCLHFSFVKHIPWHFWTSSYGENTNFPWPSVYAHYASFIGPHEVHKGLTFTSCSNLSQCLLLSDEGMKRQCPSDHEKRKKQLHDSESRESSQIKVCSVLLTVFWKAWEFKKKGLLHLEKGQQAYSVWIN